MLLVGCSPPTNMVTTSLEGVQVITSNIIIVDDSTNIRLTSTKMDGVRELDYRMLASVSSPTTLSFHHMIDELGEKFEVLNVNYELECDSQCWFVYEVEFRIYRVWLKRNYDSGIFINIIGTDYEKRIKLTETFLIDILTEFPK